MMVKTNTRRRNLAAALGAALLLTATATLADDDMMAPGYGMGPGMMGPGMMGPGMMMRPGMMDYGMMGHGMTGPGMMMGPGTMGYGYGPCGMAAAGEPLEVDDVKAMMQRRLAFMGNPRLTLGNVEEGEHTVTVEIVTKEGGALVDRLAVDRHSGHASRIR